MPKVGRKTQDMRHVSFRMPADVHKDYVAVAESRGVDLSAVLNWVVVEDLPLLCRALEIPLSQLLHGADPADLAAIDLSWGPRSS